MYQNLFLNRSFIGAAIIENKNYYQTLEQNGYSESIVSFPSLLLYTCTSSLVWPRMLLSCIKALSLLLVTIIIICFPSTVQRSCYFGVSCGKENKRKLLQILEEYLTHTSYIPILMLVFCLSLNVSSINYDLICHFGETMFCREVLEQVDSCSLGIIEHISIILC